MIGRFGDALTARSSEIRGKILSTAKRVDRGECRINQISGQFALDGRRSIRRLIEEIR
jgi:hypothetical protein